MHLYTVFNSVNITILLLTACSFTLSLVVEIPNHMYNVQPHTNLPEYMYSKLKEIYTKEQYLFKFEFKLCCV